MNFGANEKTLEDIEVKPAPNSNRKSSKSDVTVENTILPDETFLRLGDQCRRSLRYIGLDTDCQARCRISARSWLFLVLSVVHGVDTM